VKIGDVPVQYRLKVEISPICWYRRYFQFKNMDIVPILKNWYRPISSLQAVVYVGSANQKNGIKDIILSLLLTTYCAAIII